MRLDVITIFPELVESFTKHGVIRRAFESEIDLQLHNPRSFTTDKHQSVDDRPFGGGPGMVMRYEPLAACIGAIRASWINQDRAKPPVILFSPAGAKLTHARVMQFAQSEGAVLVCGRYEGIDQRFVNEFVNEELSLGDFVLSGGELAAMTLIDAVARQMPGVLNTAESALQDSFADGLLDCPHYTRPEALTGGEAVPEVLMSGNHAAIARWRREQSLKLSLERRPDLIAAARAQGLLSAADEKFLVSLL
jgi:tRNA (guanine37-N1)-methyltransferase